LTPKNPDNFRLTQINTCHLNNEKKRGYNGCFFKFGVEVGLEESIVTFCVFLICQLKNQSFLRRLVDQLFKSNLTFCVVCVFNRHFEKSVSLRRVVLSQSTPTSMPNLKKKTPFIINVTIRLYLERVKRDNTVPLFISWQLCTETSWAHGHCLRLVVTTLSYCKCTVFFIFSG
jgi:hypothetical protein